jgi:alpha-beta hydrolase superfamily lysophospholipase
MSEPTAVVFIHGMYMNGTSWEPWIERAATRGWVAQAPSWPFHDGAPGERRRDVPDGLGGLTFGAVTEHYKRILEGVEPAPFLVGHSIGGLVVQKLINDGHGRAGVALSPAPPRGVLSFDPRFFRANVPHLNPFAGSRPVLMTPKRFHYTFCNTMTRDASDAAFERYVVPESRSVPRSTLTAQGAIDFRRAHAPLLICGGDHDHLTPLAMVRRNAAKYRRSPQPVECRVFAGRSHFLCNQDDWYQVADTAFDWLAQQP